MPPVVVDTNVLVRLATGDDPTEHKAVVAALDARPWQVLNTVILETEWVLRSRYAYSPAEFGAFVDWLDQHPRVHWVDASAVRMAVEHHRAGLDFADALHMAQAGNAAFLTLDRKLLRRAAKVGLKALSVSSLVAEPRSR